MTKTNTRPDNRAGFTIVELLIVIVVIGILAAISIVAYSGIQARAREVTLKSDLATAKKQLLLYQAENGSFPRSTADLQTVGIRPTRSVYHVGDSSLANYYYCVNRTTDQFVIVARPAGSTNRGYIVSSSGDVQEVSSATSGICASTVGMTSTSDSNGFYTVGYSNSSLSWLSWVQ